MNTYCERLLNGCKEQPITKGIKKLRDFAKDAPRETLSIMLFRSLFDPSCRQGAVNLTHQLWSICRKRNEIYDLSLGEIVIDVPGTSTISKKANVWFYEGFGLLDEKYSQGSVDQDCRIDILKTLMRSQEAIGKCSSKNLMNKLLFMSEKQGYQTRFDKTPQQLKTIWNLFEEKCSFSPVPDRFLALAKQRWARNLVLNKEIEINPHLDSHIFYWIDKIIKPGMKRKPTAHSKLKGRIRLVVIKFHSNLLCDAIGQGGTDNKYILKMTCSRLVQLRDLPTLRFLDSIALQDYNAMLEDMDPEQNPFLAALLLDHFNVAKYMITRPENPLVLTGELVESIKHYIGGDNPYKAIIMEENILRFLEEAKRFEIGG